MRSLLILVLVVTFWGYMSTDAFASEHSTEGTLNELISGEWWGGVEGKMNNVIKIDEEQIHTSDSAAHYNGTWKTHKNYELVRDNGKTYLKFGKVTPEINMPDRNTLLISFSEESSPSWTSQAQGKTMVFKRTPDYVDDSYYYGKWNNRKSGFQEAVIEVRADGLAYLGGAVSSMRLCWSRINNSSIKVSPCKETQQDTQVSPGENYLKLTPTPAEEAIVVEYEKNKKRLWTKVGSKKSVHWVKQQSDPFDNFHRMPIKKKPQVSAITGGAEKLRVRCSACTYTYTLEEPVTEEQFVKCPACGQTAKPKYIDFF